MATDVAIVPGRRKAEALKAGALPVARALRDALGRGMLVCWVAGLPVAAVAQDRPLSAIDWLSSSVAPPSGTAARGTSAGQAGARQGSTGQGITGQGSMGQGAAARAPGRAATPVMALQPPEAGSGTGRGSAAVLPPVPGEPPVSKGVTDEPVTVSAIGLPPANGIGLLSAESLGLPGDLWGETPETELAALLRKERVDTLPAIQSFLMELLLARFAPPQETAGAGRDMLFLARVDRLLDMGALDQAMALLEDAESADPEIFRRRFDVALLLGEEDKACEIMADTPNVAPSFPARIFCLARSGDWPAAALSYDSGVALGQIDPEMDELLARFLEPELAEDGAPLPPPSRPSPLVFRMLEAIGEPMPTGGLPVAFAQADLRANTGWKAQIEAAERLTRMGVLDPNHLLGLYTQERASASGGIWDRVSLISRLDLAVQSGDRSRTAAVLPGTWEAMQSQDLEPALAAMFGDRLAAMQLPAEAGEIAFRLGLLTPAFEDNARTHTETATPEGEADASTGPFADHRDEALLRAVAQGDTSKVAAQDRLGLMLKQVFDAPPQAAPAPYAAQLDSRKGEMLLAAIDDITEGAKGDYRRVENGLKLLRRVGLETVARRSALELVVLERNG